ncbi:hypothetical protein [Aurantiacibacter poecillastricola]|uniref:hypothetical protein n=1 Tax=Aurantiacibacter poecillastricola TaxID=3064385 RepID=UPI002740060E|nr:hypothetical protein [Aurantiacibacter sp. 219JJ12-13]MDP5263167.1 hypothetical protein [Aurantiacibacter sp. 219JJ12-13]
MSNRAHENFEDYSSVTGPSNRAFGLTVGAILCAIGLVRWLAFAPSTWSTLLFLVPGGVLLALGFLAPAPLTPLNRAWTKLGLLLASIVNPVMMALIYFLIFVPVGLGMKLFGRDALRQRRGGGGSTGDEGTYWITREPAGPAPDTMKNQF